MFDMFDQIPTVLPTSIDNNKILSIKKCLSIWICIWILSLCNILIYIYGLFVANSFLEISVVVIMILLFCSIFLVSFYNFIILRRYLGKLLVVKNLIETKDSYIIKIMSNASHGKMSF